MGAPLLDELLDEELELVEELLELDELEELEELLLDELALLELDELELLDEELDSSGSVVPFPPQAVRMTVDDKILNPIIFIFILKRLPIHSNYRFKSKAEL